MPVFFYYAGTGIWEIRTNSGIKKGYLKIALLY